MLAMSTETVAEATAVVAATRAELTVYSAEMTATGAKVPITNAPTGVGPMQMVSRLRQIIPMPANAATTGAKTVADVMKPPKTLERLEEERAGMGYGRSVPLVPATDMAIRQPSAARAFDGATPRAACVQQLLYHR